MTQLIVPLQATLDLSGPEELLHGIYETLNFLFV